MAKSFYTEIVALHGSVFKGDTVSLRAPGEFGSFEVLHNHAPMLCALGIGPIYLTTPDGDKIVFASSGGFVQVINNHVIVLADTAEAATEIDVERAKAAEKRALDKLNSETTEDRETAQQELERARNRLRLSMGKVGR